MDVGTVTQLFMLTGRLYIEHYPSRIFGDCHYCMLVRGFQPNARGELFEVDFGLGGVR